MVKSVFSDEARSNSAEDRLFKSGISAQVGLVIGRLNPTSERGLVYDFIPTPPTDEGGPACSLKSEATGGGGGGGKDGKKGSKGGKPSAEAPASIVIDTDWVAEHARQVSRMLLGGMSVIGIYLWASEATFKATSPALLSQVVKGVAQTAPSHNSEVGERLLIYISYSPRRWACRICTLSSSSLRPCDFKMSKLIAFLQAFRCTYNFEMRLPIFQAGTSGLNLKNVVCKAIKCLSKDLQCAKALISGNLVTEDLQVSSESVHDVEFLMPFNKSISGEECSSEEVDGLIVYSGAICALTYLGPKEPIVQAISDLKSDIISSLSSRLDIITDETEEEAAVSSAGGCEASGDAVVEKSLHRLTQSEIRKLCTFTFPRRILVPWLDGIFICDYLRASETFEMALLRTMIAGLLCSFLRGVSQLRVTALKLNSNLKDMKDHCIEMMSMEVLVETTSIEDPETVPSSATAKSFWDVVHGHLASPVDESIADKNSTKTEVQPVQSKRSNLNFLSAILVLLLALFVGCVIVFFGPYNS